MLRRWPGAAPLPSPFDYIPASTLSTVSIDLIAEPSHLSTCQKSNMTARKTENAPSSASRILRLCSYFTRSLPSKLFRYKYSRLSLVLRRIIMRQLQTATRRWREELLSLPQPPPLPPPQAAPVP